MRVFFMRHTDAQPLDPEGNDRDEDREINKAGEKRIIKEARGLRRLAIFPDRIFSSPLKRAVQSSELIAKELNFSGDIEAVDELSPLSDPGEIIEVLKELHDDQLLLVGHQPMLGQIISQLIGTGNSGNIGLKKGGFARVDVMNWNDDPPGQLRWLFTSKQLGWMKKKKRKAEAGEAL